MKILALYILKIFAQRTMLVAGTLIGVLLMFDVMANAGDIIADKENSMSLIFTYMSWRLPAVIVTILPLAVLISTLLTMAQLANRQEITILYSSGMNLYMLAGILLIGGLIISLLHFAIAEIFLTNAAYKLRVWSENDYQYLPKEEDQRTLPLWLKVDNALMFVENASADGSKLYNLSTLYRDSNGNPLEYFSAKQAIYEGNGNVWRFENVYWQNLADGQKKDLSELRTALSITPDRFSVARKNMFELTMGELSRLSDTRVTDEQPNFIYDLWLQKKFVNSLSILVMIMLAVPLGFQLARRNQMYAAALAIIAVGFGYFFFDRFLLSMGETGQLPILVAAWVPSILFSGCVSLYVIVRHK